MSGRSAVVLHHTAIFSPIKTVNLPGSGFVFSTKVKKKKSGILDKAGGGISLNTVMIPAESCTFLLNTVRPK